MKAIISAPQNSLYHRMNGLTFNVNRMLLQGAVCLDINGTLTDFGPGEVLIVDFETELQNAYDAVNFCGNSEEYRLYNSLAEYKRVRNIDFELEYNCPA